MRVSTRVLIIALVLAPGTACVPAGVPPTPMPISASTADPTVAPTRTPAVTLALPPPRIVLDGVRRGTVQLNAGVSVRLVVDQTDPLCADPRIDSFLEFSYPCRVARITAPAAGRLTVEVDAEDPLTEFAVAVPGSNCCSGREVVELSGPGVIEISVQYIHSAGGGVPTGERRLRLLTTFVPFSR